MSLLTITRETTSVSLAGERLQVKLENGESHDVPLCELHHVIVCGRPHVSLHAFFAVMERGCRVDFMTGTGKWLGSVGGKDEMKPERLRLQVRCSDDPGFRLLFGRALISTKLKNQHRVLARLAARRKLRNDCLLPLCHLKSLAGKIREAQDEDSLRGMEGLSSLEYFRALNLFLPPDFRFSSRTRNPPRDPANALLSFCYTVTAVDLDGALRKHGLESVLGLFHHSNGTFQALAWDLLEIFRAPFCDMLCLNLLNHRILRKEHFELNRETGGTFLTHEGKKIFFKKYEEKKASSFSLPGTSEKTSYGAVFERQVMLVLDWLQGHSVAPFFQMP